ncbi:Trafficking protein particle complex subunit 31 [Malassezia pachydermatis]
MSAASKEGSRRSSLAPTASVPDVLDRPRDKTRSVDVSRSALQYLFAEMVSYTQGRVSGISDFERLLSTMGRRVGVRFLAMTAHRTQLASNPKKPQRETRLLKTLLWLQSTFWKAVFGAQADSLERSTESDRSDEYMISTNTPLLSQGLSVPKEMEQLSVEAFTAGIMEGALDALGFPARVTAHSVPTEAYPYRTTILIKLDASVMEREAALGGP